MADEDRKSQKERVVDTEAPVIDADTPAEDDKVGASQAIEAPALDTGLDGTATAKGPEEETPVVQTQTPEGETPEEGVVKGPELDPVMDLSQEEKPADSASDNDTAQPKNDAVDLDAEESAPVNGDSQPMMSDEEMVSRFNAKHMPLINEIWGVPQVDDQLMEALGQSGDIRKSKFGLEFTLPNGHRLEWHQNLGGAEFIGMSKRTANFDMDDAHATIAASKSRGWNAINVHGSKEEKEMLWLEAQRQGLEVTNFIPMADSDVRRQWEQEQQKKLDELGLRGATPSTHQMDPDLAQKEIKDLETDTPADSTPPADEAEQKKEPEAVDSEVAAEDKDISSSKLFKPMAPAPAEDADVDTAGKEVKNEVELPAGSLTLQQFFEREEADPTNSPEMSRGYMEMKAAMFEGKLDAADIDAIQLGRSEGMGGNSLRQKMDGKLTAAEFNDLAEQLQGLMRDKGGEPDFKIGTRLDVSGEPSSPALKTDELKEAQPAKRTAGAPKATM